jgi:hypothetical protein
MTWLLIKMVSNWNRINPRGRPVIEPTAEFAKQVLKAKQQYETPEQEAKLRIYAVSSLLGSLVSMLFALFGGLICRGQIWINFIR